MNPASRELIFNPDPNLPKMAQDINDWLAAGIEMVWIPIIERGPGPRSAVAVQEGIATLDGPFVIVDAWDFYCLPIGVKGWLIPAHQDDTDVICVRTEGGEVAFGPVIHPITEQRLTYRSCSEAEILGF
jgi:hypothetical protein